MTALTPLIPALIAASTLSPSAAQAVSIFLDPNETFSAHNDLITSIPGTFLGANVNNLIGANRFYNAGFTGQGTITANVEAGQIWNGHETLGQVTTYVADPTTFHTGVGPEFDRHATWVGMMIGGRNGGADQGPWQTGIAPNTNLRSGAIATGWVGNAYSLNFNLTNRTLATAYGAYFGQADVINSSWGGTDPNGTGGIALLTDGLANQNTRTTFVASAGNSGPGANTVGSPGSGYNKITVGALQNNGNNVYTTVANFSSRGPQDYADPVHGVMPGVRAAVDIAAPGTDLTSAYYGGQTGGNNPTLPGSPSGLPGGPNFYTGGLAGTSFAAPITTGAAALIDSASYNTPTLAGNADSRDARVVKAVLLNSADKIPGWDNGQHMVGGVITTTQSLDWASGTGGLNLNRAYDQYINAGTRDVPGLGGGTVFPMGWDFGQVANGQTNSYFLGGLLGNSALTVTLDWFRDRLVNLSTLTAQDIAQANLDLILKDVISDTIVAESVSPYNVVEHLNFLLPRTSIYEIDVSYNGNTFGNVSSEDYGLAWSGRGAVSMPTSGTLALLAAGVFAAMVRRAGQAWRRLSLKAG